MSYRINKERAKFRTTKPSKTDQSAAKDTDVNVIMKQYNITGMIAGSKIQPQFGDYTQARDLKGMLDLQRNLRTNHASLHAKLQELPLDELFALTEQQITDILAPPAQPPVPEQPKT